jgi:homoserine dehydrogenase
MAARVGVALLGCGVVGKGVYDLIRANGEDIASRKGVSLDLVGIGVRDLEKDRGVPLELCTTDFFGLIENPDVDIVIEAVGGVEPAMGWLERALSSGKSVATANKELMANSGAKLIGLARASHADLRYEASVAAGIPIIAALDRQLSGNKITRIEGILNGTTNFILTNMSKSGMSFADALSEAQALGFAEADPSSDVDGFDSAYKIAILASIATAMSQDWSQVARSGIRNVEPSELAEARGRNAAVKLVAECEISSQGARMSVRTKELPPSHPLSHVDGSTNAIVISGDPVGTLTFFGPGAGAGPTASALVGDIVEMAVNTLAGRVAQPYTWHKP